MVSRLAPFDRTGRTTPVFILDRKNLVLARSMHRRPSKKTMRFSTNIRLRPYKLNSANIAEVLAIDCTVTPHVFSPHAKPLMCQASALLVISLSRFPKPLFHVGDDLRFDLAGWISRTRDAVLAPLFRHFCSLNNNVCRSELRLLPHSSPQ
jgi:hypothetical protein